MEWQNWVSVVFLLLPTFLLVPFGWGIMCKYNHDPVGGLGVVIAATGFFFLYLFATVTEDTPGLRDAGYKDQPESRDSLLQQREYLEVRLWEMKTERQAMPIRSSTNL